MKYVVTVNGKNYEVDVEQGEARVLSVKQEIHNVPTSALLAVQPVQASAPAPIAAPVGVGQVLLSPMPGTVVDVFKQPQDTVVVGEVVLILEAMKMENEIVAQHSGIVAQVMVSKGSVIKTGDVMVVIQ